MPTNKRPPRAKKGEIKAKWGKLPGYKPDICYAGGTGTSRSDLRLLNDTIVPIAEELRKRGYDVTTIRFSIEMRDDASTGI